MGISTAGQDLPSRPYGQGQTWNYKKCYSLVPTSNSRLTVLLTSFSLNGTNFIDALPKKKTSLMIILILEVAFIVTRCLLLAVIAAHGLCTFPYNYMF